MYATSQQLDLAQILIRLDGGYGDTVVLSDFLAMGLGLIARSRDYALLGRPARAGGAFAPAIGPLYPSRKRGDP